MPNFFSQITLKWTQLDMTSGLVNLNVLSWTTQSTQNISMKFCLHSSNTQQQFHGNISLISNSINSYYQRTSLNESLLTTPVFIDIILLPCPPGFNLTDYPHHCDCYPILSANSFKCSFINKTGCITWNSTMWVNAIFTRPMESILSVRLLHVRRKDLEHCWRAWCTVWLL